MKTILRPAHTRFAVVLLAAVASGCATYDYQSAEMQQQSEYQILREENQKLQGLLEGIQLEQERLRIDLDRLRAEQSRGLDSKVSAIQSSVEDLNRRLASEVATREREKQAMIDQLSKNIAKAVATAAPPRSSGGSSKKASGEGYEHVVEAGQTLSAIASAYGVKPADVLSANNLKNPDQLRVGQKLFIPKP